MRAIFFFLILTIFLMMGCASVEVAKEMTKATKSLEISVKKIFKSKKKKGEVELDKADEKKQEILKEEQESSIEEDWQKQKILVEKQEIFEEQKKVSEVVKKQKKISTISLLDKTMEEIKQLIGLPIMTRKDGKTIIARYNSSNCRLFIFMNSSLKVPRVEYYELRNNKGELIDQQNKIRLCFKEIKVG